MSTGLDTSPSTRMFDVEALVKLVWEGRIRVPHFQRGFRWHRQDVIRLFEEAMHRAVAFLQDEAGVPHFSMLAYRHLLIVLTRLFAHHPEPDERSRRLLRRCTGRPRSSGRRTSREVPRARSEHCVSRCALTTCPDPSPICSRL